MYVGRFAPSPTGPLHFGSLVAALASWLDARSAGGRWLVRIEDLDSPRVQPGAADDILRTLEALGLYWDDAAVFQSQRKNLYRCALDALNPHLYWCGCSRREVADSSPLGLATDGARIYPGTCRLGLPAGKTARALRVRVEAGVIAFADRLQGFQRQDLPREVGDFVLARREDQFTYQLAAVVDDAEQAVSHIVRGADLLDSSARQIHLQRLLGYREPAYLHVPVAVDAAGEKLSKQTGAPPVGPASGRQVLRKALAFLGQPDTDDLSEAARNWRPALIPPVRTYRVD